MFCNKTLDNENIDEEIEEYDDYFERKNYLLSIYNNIINIV